MGHHPFRTPKTTTTTMRSSGRLLFALLIAAPLLQLGHVQGQSSSGYFPSSGMPGKYPPIQPDPKDVRQESISARRIFEFKSYRDGQLFHFEVPLDTRTALWTFYANYTAECRPGRVFIYLQPGSYPVVDPHNGRFPSNMKPLGVYHNLSFIPDHREQVLMVPSPAPGHWFMLAYSSELEMESLAKKTLTVKCSTWLRTKAEYHLEPSVIQLFPEKHNHQKLLLYHNIDRTQTYRFYTGRNVWSSTVTLNKCRVKIDPNERRMRMKDRSQNDYVDHRDSCPILLTVAAKKPPDPRNPRTRRRDCLDDSDVHGCSLKLFPEEESWHYITITPTRTDRRVEFVINVVINDCPHPTEKINYFLANKINPHEVCSDVTKNTASAIQLLFPPYQAQSEPGTADIFRKCGKRIHLVRKTLPGVFMFEYELPFQSGMNSSRRPISSDSSPPMTLDLENDLPSVMEFPVGVGDIGGTLVLEIGVNNGRLSGISSETIHLKACLSHGRHLIPTLAAHFDPFGPNDVYNMPPDNIAMGNMGNDASKSYREREHDKEEAALCPGGRLISLNVSAAERIPVVDRILVPYPQEGRWFLTLLPSCTKVNIRRGNQETTYESTSCSRNTTPVVFTLYSDMCVMGGCGSYGRCYQFFSGGNMFSTCTCFAGYKGWGCTDDSSATSEIDLLAATLLLCLSNMLFLPAVGLAVYRGFYTESFIYFANMIFSTLFHACDQDVFSFCLMKYTVLQFCDYYTATMSFWVTALAMGGMPDQAKSLLHMVGAVGVALGIEYDRSGIFTFLVPGVIGVIILFGSWVSHCSTDHTCYPSLKYTCCFFFPGVAVLAGGLFCFMILEEESNYQFVHSAWHMSMAVAIIFLLPQAPRQKADKYEILDRRSSFPAPESSFKHYADENGPEIINVTSGASSTILPPDQVIDVTRTPSMPALHQNGPTSILGGATLPRSNLAKHNRSTDHLHIHGTMKKPMMGHHTHHHHHHHHQPDPG